MLPKNMLTFPSGIVWAEEWAMRLSRTRGRLMLIALAHLCVGVLGLYLFPGPALEPGGKPLYTQPPTNRGTQY